MPFVWNNENTIKFLELLESETIIWNVYDNNHKFKHKVHDAWKRISEALEDIPIFELKSKRKSLMATFRPLLKKKLNSIRSGAGSDDIFEPIWLAFDVMERFLGSTFTVRDTLNTEEQLLRYDSTPPTQTSNEDEAMPPRPPQPVVTESSQRVHNTATKSNAKRKHMDIIISEADQKINDSLASLSRVLERDTGEDECDVYAKLLAKKLRKYPENMRDRIMHKIDGLLLDNPYPDEQASSASTSYASHIYSMPSPYASSPQYVSTSPQYAPYQTYFTSKSSSATPYSNAPVYIHIPEEDVTEEGRYTTKELDISILSDEVIVPSKKD